MHHLLAISTTALALAAAATTTWFARQPIPLAHPSPTTLVATPTPPTTAPAPNDSLLHPGPITQPPSDQLLADILKAIAANRQRLHTLQYDASIYDEFSRDGQKSAEKSITGKALIEIANQRRFHLDISDDTNISSMPTRTSPKNWHTSHNSYTATWDGQIANMLYGPPLSSDQASTAHFPNIVPGNELLGTSYSVHLMQNKTSMFLDKSLKGKSIIQDFFDPDNLHQYHLSACRRLLNGHELIALEVTPTPPTTTPAPTSQPGQFSSWSYTYWFDPTRGYALIASEHLIDNLPFEQNFIDDLTELSPGTWFPTQAHSLAWTLSRTTNQRILFFKETFTAQNILPNPPLDPTLFHLDIPAKLPTRSIDPQLPPTKRASTPPKP